MVHNQYLKLRDLKLYFMKSNISKVSDFELYLFSTVLFATLKTRSKKIIRGTGPNSTGTGTGQEFRSGPSSGTGANPVLVGS